MTFDPKSHARAAVLAGAMTLDPSPYDLLETRVPAIRRTLTNTVPPLDLTAVVFRYRETDGQLAAVRPRRFGARWRKPSLSERRLSRRTPKITSPPR